MKRMEGLVPKLEEFHNQAEFLQVIWKILYSTASSKDIGTLHAARNTINAKNVSKDPVSNYYASSELIDKLTKATISRPDTITTDMDELQPDFKAALQPFYRAEDSITGALVQQVIQEGVAENLWLATFQPNEGEEFNKYLTQRLKNERKNIKQSQKLELQERSITEYLSKSLKEVSEEGGDRGEDGVGVIIDSRDCILIL